MLLAAGGVWSFRSPGPAGPDSAMSDHPGPTPPAAAGPLVELALTPLGDSTGPSASVQVPRGSAQVRFLLGGDLPTADALTAEISAVDRDAVRRWPVDDAPPGTEGAARAVTVPVYAVPDGAYSLTVWAGDADVVQRYTFRIAAP